MATLGTIVKYVFLVLFTAILAGQLAVLVLVQSASGVALDPAFYKNELQAAGIYDYAYAKLNQSVTEKGGGQASAMMTLSGISMTDILTKDWIKRQAENLIDHGLAYLKGQSQSAELWIDLTEPKTKLFAAADAKIQQLPESLQDAATTQKAAFSEQIDRQVPDKVNLAEQPGAQQQLLEARNAVGTLQTILLGLVVFALVLAVLIVVLARKSIHSIVRWLGAGLILGGALAFGLLGLVQSKLNEALPTIAGGPEAPMLTKLAADGFAAVQGAAFPLAGVLVVVGLVGIAASFLFKPVEETEGKSEANRGLVTEGKKRK
ncbi:hypothetical protein HY994_06755 [Candidatus Micrarchaeota archaeon]|nr:hypothetical protein [Candidatus Micrarchaeota archaeon]